MYQLRRNSTHEDFITLTSSGQSYNNSTIVNYDSRRENCPYYNSRLVNYDGKLFIRLGTVKVIFNYCACGIFSAEERKKFFFEFKLFLLIFFLPLGGLHSGKLDGAYSAVTKSLFDNRD